LTDGPTHNPTPGSAADTPAEPRRSSLRKWLLFTLRWGIAVLGITYVVWNINLDDHVWVIDDATSRPVLVALADQPNNSEHAFPIRIKPNQLASPETLVPRDHVLTRADRKTVLRDSDGAKLYVLGLGEMRQAGDAFEPSRVFVSDSAKGKGFWLSPTAIRGGFTSEVEFPAIEIGLRRMLAQANTTYLFLAVGVLPIVYLITGFRWWLLLRGLQVPIGLWRSVQINLVGTFYNTFMPGQTGGDLIKAYYAAKNAAGFRTRAVLSVILDRLIGLLALVIMGGVCASLQWHIPQCRQVAIAAMILVGGTALAISIMAITPLRQALGLDWLLARLPMQEKLGKAVEALRTYKRHPGQFLLLLGMSFPVHATIVISAMFAGWAFALPLQWAYYWVVVPTITLAGALPISPQGAGVMEFFAILLTKPQGATVGQAFALTMSIRLVQIFWNLLAGIVVLTGGYHQPSQVEIDAADDAR
jgi:uncharacterized protein (TIRG00374 family)